jgi:hypothetical protein
VYFANGQTDRTLVPYDNTLFAALNRVPLRANSSKHGQALKKENRTFNRDRVSINHYSSSKRHKEQLKLLVMFIVQQVVGSAVVIVVLCHLSVEVQMCLFVHRTYIPRCSCSCAQATRPGPPSCSSAPLTHPASCLPAHGSRAAAAKTRSREERSSFHPI